MKGCWTCKDRKVSCDRERPACRRCIQFGRVCMGYGTRLSWPKENDRKRAIVSRIACRSKHVSPMLLLQADFVNVHFSDVENSHNLLDPSSIVKRASLLPSLLQNPSWLPLPLKSSQVDLFAYFQNNVARLVSTSHPVMENLVIRMAFTDASPASQAILYTIYALSSLHLADTQQAYQYKQNAIGAVWASAARDHSTKDTLQRIVATNYLAVFETMANTNVTVEVATRVCYSKTSAINMFDLGKSYQGDLGLILDWVYYYDVLSKFGIQHYSGVQSRMLVCAQKKHLTYVEMNSPDIDTIVPTLGCSLSVMGGISCMLDILLNLEKSGRLNPDAVDGCERRLKYSRQVVKLEDIDDRHSGDAVQRTEDIAELYRLAGIIYLYRAIRRSPLWTQCLHRSTTSAFEILSRLETCERTFPLFIIGCEARSDTQRASILRIIRNTQESHIPANMIRVGKYIERFWAQDDLDVNQDIEYSAKVTAVLSSGEGLSLFM